MVQHLVSRFPTLRAVVVGDGALAAELQTMAVRLGVAGHVEFAGHRTDVEAFLQRAKVFVLTSDSEGVALSMMEAMTAGAAPVVSNVGDLADVIDASSGFLVDDLEPATYARAVAAVIAEPARLAAVSRAAVERAARYSVHASTMRWGVVLGRVPDSLEGSVAHG